MEYLIYALIVVGIIYLLTGRKKKKPSPIKTEEKPKTSLVKDPEDKETLEYVYKHFDYDRYATEVLDTTVYKETPFGVLVKPQ